MCQLEICQGFEYSKIINVPGLKRVYINKGLLKYR